MSRTTILVVIGYCTAAHAACTLVMLESFDGALQDSWCCSVLTLDPDSSTIAEFPPPPSPKSPPELCLSSQYREV